MAQSKVQKVTGIEGLGGLGKARFAQIQLVNTAAETATTLTPADVGMQGFVMWGFVAEAGIGPIAVPTYVGGLCTSLAVTHSAGAEVDCFVIGV